MKPSIGRIVMTKGVVHSNGTDEHPAIITRVWNDADPIDNPGLLVNLTIFPDLMSPQVRGSVPMFDTMADGMRGGLSFCYWPERVS